MLDIDYVREDGLSDRVINEWLYGTRCDGQMIILGIYGEMKNCWT